MFQCFKRNFCCQRKINTNKKNIKTKTNTNTNTNTNTKQTYILKLENDKYYVGESNNIERRIWIHENGNGPQWTKNNNVIQRINPIFNPDKNFNELTQTLLMMHKHGIENVRGSLFTSPFPLSNYEKIIAAQLYCELNNLCRKCGGNDHFISNCKNTIVQPWVKQFGGILSFENLSKNINNKSCLTCNKDISSLPSNYRYCRSCFFKKE